MRRFWVSRSTSVVGSTAVPRSTSAAGSKRPSRALVRVLSDFRDLFRPYRRAFAIGFALVVANRLLHLVRPAISKFVLDDVVMAGRGEMLWPLIGLLGVSMVLQSWSSYALKLVISTFVNKLVTDLRIQIQAHIGRLPVSYFDANKTGALVSRVMSDAEGLNNLLSRGFMQSAGDIVTAIAAVGIMLWLNVPITLVSLALMSAFYFIVRRIVRVIRPIFVERQRIQANVRGRLTESFGGIRLVKAFHAEAREARAFRDGAGQILTSLNDGTRITAVMSMISSFLLGLIGTVVLIMGARSVVSGAMTIGEYVSYTLVLAIVVLPLSQMVEIGSDFSNAIASLDRIREVMAETPEDVDAGRTRRLDKMQGRVEFDEVSFQYVPGRLVLQDISLDAKPGTVTAIVGSTGSGKSTLVGLVAAFHKPLSGRISVDGVDLGTVRLDSLRSQLGVVLQDNFIFDGTVRDNIRFGRPDATDGDVEGAARVAGVDALAASLEHGYETMIGERGVKVSGGQRQRIAIARAILADPRILILDEATSNLDRESEAHIQHSLASLMRGRTTFVIAHRLSTVRHADQILVLEDGRIVERGTHKELMARGGRYHELYTWQVEVADLAAQQPA